jgi:hypothetical protein
MTRRRIVDRRLVLPRTMRMILDSVRIELRNAIYG